MKDFLFLFGILLFIAIFTGCNLSYKPEILDSNVTVQQKPTIQGTLYEKK